MARTYVRTNCQVPGCGKPAACLGVMFDVGSVRLCRDHETVNMALWVKNRTVANGTGGSALGAKPTAERRGA